MKKKWFRYFGSLAGICLFIAALFVIHQKLHQYHIADIIDKARQTPPGIFAFGDFYYSIGLFCFDAL